MNEWMMEIGENPTDFPFPVLSGRLMRKLVREVKELVYKLICVYFIIIIWVMVLCFVDLQAIRRNLEPDQYFSSAVKQRVYRWKESLDGDFAMYEIYISNPHTWTKGAALLSNQTFSIMYWNYQEIFFLLLLFMHGNQLANMTYISLPTWITNVIDKLCGLLPRMGPSDSEPPELEMDPQAYKLLTKYEQRKKLTKVKKCNKGGGGGDKENEFDSQVKDSGGKVEYFDREVGEKFVFDQEFGVIPASTRDRWRQGGNGRQISSRGVSVTPKAKKDLPPVRYSRRASISLTTDG